MSFGFFRPPLMVISSSMVAESLGDLLDLAGQRGVELGPGVTVPDLDVIAGADHDDVLAERAVVGQEARHTDAARAVELRVLRVGREEGVQAPGLARERVAALERG